MKTLMIVEDEKLIRQGIKSMVLRSGVDVEEIIECNNGLAALEILEKQNVDVMFTDIRMPKMDGISLVKEIQKMTKKPLIAAISGFDEFDYAVEMMRNGVNEYILKPVDRDKLAKVLKKFDDIITEEKESYEKQRQVVYQEMQYMMIYDNVTHKEMQSITEMARAYFQVKNFVVCCFSCPESEIDDEMDGKYYYLEGKDSLNILIVDSEYKDEVLKSFDNYYIGISNVYYNLLDLRQAYHEAATMRKTAFETMIKRVDAAKFSKPDEEYEYGVKFMMQTANLICSNKLDEAIEQLESFVDGVKARKYYINEFKEQMEIILNTTIKVYQNTLKVGEDDIMELSDIYSFQTIDEYMEVVKRWIRGFDELVSTDIDEHKANIKIKNAIKYIQENYATDLNMAVVSNYVSMNYSLFSFTFKQYTGTNFVNYLKDIRIGEAKKLLTDTDMKINEISQAVGYEHEKHFMKTFKAITGLTPSQYRNNLG